MPRMKRPPADDMRLGAYRQAMPTLLAGLDACDRLSSELDASRADVQAANGRCANLEMELMKKGQLAHDAASHEAVIASGTRVLRGSLLFCTPVAASLVTVLIVLVLATGVTGPVIATWLPRPIYLLPSLFLFVSCVAVYELHDLGSLACERCWRLFLAAAWINVSSFACIYALLVKTSDGMRGDALFTYLAFVVPGVLLTLNSRSRSLRTRKPRAGATPPAGTAAPGTAAIKPFAGVGSTEPEVGVMSRRMFWISMIVVVVALVVGLGYRLTRPTPVPPVGQTRVVINEAVRTMLYLPLYHAVERGYFAKEGLDVEIVTGGTATIAMAALGRGEAQFAVADPMYAPIQMQHEGRARVVAQVVGRIAVWGLAGPKVKGGWSTENVRGKRVATQQRPMTAYVYATEAIRRLGLNPDKDVTLIEGRPGTEIAPLASGDADFAFTLEPNASIAESRGGRVVVSFPAEIGDRVFTGLLTTSDYLSANDAVVRGAVSALQKSLNELAADPAAAAPTIAKYFKQVDPDVAQNAVQRLLRDQVIPGSVEISEQSWVGAIAARIAAGDLKEAVPRAKACALDIMQQVAHASGH